MSDERLGLPSASFSIRYKCHGAWNLIQACKKAALINDDGNAAAESGTLIHKARAGESVELDDNQESMRAILEEIEQRTISSLYSHLTLLSREERLWLRKGLEPVFSGKYDVVYADFGHHSAAIFDYKTGWAEVDSAERNLQMRDLAALWHFHFPWTETVDVIVLQPRITHEPSICRYDTRDLNQALDFLNDNLVKIADPDAPRTPGHHCKYCPAHAHCEEAKNYSIQAPRLLLRRIEAGEVSLPSGAKGKAVLESIDAGYKILNALWEAYENLIAEDPNAIPGWHLSDGREIRKITEYRQARDILGAFIPSEELDDASEFGLGKLEKAFCNHAGIIQRKAKERFNEILSNVMEITNAKPSLKPIPTRGRRALKQ